MTPPSGVRDKHCAGALVPGCSFSRTALVGRLGGDYTSWFSDSRSGDFRYMDWIFGCRAKKSVDVEPLWRYTPCGTHA